MSGHYYGKQICAKIWTNCACNDTSIKFGTHTVKKACNAHQIWYSMFVPSEMLYMA